MPSTTTSVTRNCAADWTMKPRPLVAAISSAATSVDQPTPRPMRMPVRMSGSALGRITWRISCALVAPSDCAARSLAGSTVRTPVAVAMAIGAKIAR
ncbi:hypothetical protein D3C76_1561620 [compost metagenome]